MALEEDIDALTTQIQQLQALVMAVIDIMGISRQRLGTEYGVTFPDVGA